MRHSLALALTLPPTLTYQVKSCAAIRSNYALFSLGLVNSLYEAALYVFVFMWAPSL